MGAAGIRRPCDLALGSAIEASVASLLPCRARRRAAGLTSGMPEIIDQSFGRQR
jgi:hypothetical protein